MVILLSGCYERDNYLDTKGEKWGYIPVYSDTFRDLRDTIKSLPPRAIIKSGKIYLYQQWLFINEQGKGVHVYDNSSPANPVPVCFLEIPGNYDVLCKDNTMYAESYFGLICLNIANLPQISDVKFTSTSLPTYNGRVYQMPGFYSAQQYVSGRSNSSSNKVYFECIDNSRGFVVAWKYGILNDPKCHTVSNNDYYE